MYDGNNVPVLKRLMRMSDLKARGILTRYARATDSALMWCTQSVTEGEGVLRCEQQLPGAPAQEMQQRRRV